MPDWVDEGWGLLKESIRGFVNDNTLSHGAGDYLGSGSAGTRLNCWAAPYFFIDLLAWNALRFGRLLRVDNHVDH